MIALVITTVGSRSDAERIASILLQERLAACVSIFPVTSLYRRKGRITKDDESMLFIKTSQRRLRELIKRLKEIHPYELPEILVFNVEASKEYEQRVEESTK